MNVYSTESCPQCGFSPIKTMRVLSYPPYDVKECPSCGYYEEVKFNTNVTVEIARQDGEAEEKKPPLGIEPRISHEIGRAHDLFNAMKRYAEAGKIISLEWVEELEDVCESIYKLRNK